MKTIFEKHKDLLEWSNLSRNPSLTPALIEKYKDKLNWDRLSANPAIFSFERGIVNHIGGV